MSDFDRIEPVNIHDVPASGAHRRSGFPRRAAFTVGALLILAAAAFAVFVLLPGLVTPSGPTPVQASSESAPTPTGAKVRTDLSPTSDAPFYQEQQNRARRMAQDVLTKLVDLQERLQNLAVMQWAGDAFRAATATALAGDEAFRTRDYDQAVQRYQQALTDLQAIANQRAGAVRSLLDQADHAFAREDSAAAERDYQLALTVDPDSTTAREGVRRARMQPQVLELMARSRRQDSRGELTEAAASVKQALDLDEKATGARERLRDLNTRITRQRFDDLMSRGYQALRQGDPDAAEREFRAADRAIKDGPGVATGLEETAIARTLRDIRLARERAETAVANENWSLAIEQYRKALQLDGTLLFARDGLAIARQRQEFDQRAQLYIDEPQRLFSKTVFDAAENHLRQLRAIASPGPRLNGQIEAIDAHLRDASTPVEVTLTSDNRTEVTVYKVGRLGNFRQHQLMLRPGSYTAVGSRDGYRDVRTEFTVAVGPAPAPVQVICSERI